MPLAEFKLRHYSISLHPEVSWIQPVELHRRAFDSFQILLPGGELLFGPNDKVDGIWRRGRSSLQSGQNGRIHGLYSLEQHIGEIRRGAEAQNLAMEATDYFRRYAVSEIRGHGLPSRFIGRCGSNPSKRLGDRVFDERRIVVGLADLVDHKLHRER